MITPVEPWEEPYDAELAALLREGPAELAPPPGAFRRIRRRAARRRWARAAAAGGVTAAVIGAAATLWPAPDQGAPTVPLAPPAATSTSAPGPTPTRPARTTPTPQPDPSRPRPTASPARDSSGVGAVSDQTPQSHRGLTDPDPGTARRITPSTGGSPASRTRR
ncbi:hypothetical protein [Streptomyces sp. NPDC021224]|uniref:hypothetical protein n=1 Tax=unclassified Streptomyces TaxID=2593676 RepID=UPI0037A999B3